MVGPSNGLEGTMAMHGGAHCSSLACLLTTVSCCLVVIGVDAGSGLC